MDIDKLVDAYYRKIYKLALFYLRDAEEAEDMAQEIFYKAMKKQSSFKEQSSEYTWLYRVAVNAILNHIKRKKILQFISFENVTEQRETKLLCDPSNPANIMEEEQLKEVEIGKLQEGINRLSAREKSAFFLFHYDNMKQKEIAQVMETSVSAVESLIHKAMKKIKASVGKG